MDQKFEGTPNPLNPNPGGTPEGATEPVAPATKPVVATQPSAPTTKPAINVQPRPTTTRPVTSARPSAQVTNSQPTKPAEEAQPSAPHIAADTPPDAVDAVIAPTAPSSTNEIMAPVAGSPKAVVTEVKSDHKVLKKRSLIVGGIVAVFVAVGCGVVAALMLINHPKDPVSAAIQKILDGGYNQNLTANGTINVSIKNEDIPYSKAVIDLDSKFTSGLKSNATTAKITATPRNEDTPVKVDLEEVLTENKDLYLKLETEKKTLIKSSDANNLDSKEKSDSESVSKLSQEDAALTTGLDESNSTTTTSEDATESSVASSMDAITKSLESIDGKWIKAQISSATESISDADDRSTMQCVSSLLGNINSNLKSLATLYQTNPFLTSSTEQIPIASKDSPLRRLVLDRNKFTNFVESIKKLPEVNEFASCVSEDESTINANELMEEISKLPAVYVEVNKDNQFTRFYFNYQDESINVETDLSLTYPESQNIVEPTDFIEAEELSNQFFQSYTNTEHETIIEEEPVNP